MICPWCDFDSIDGADNCESCGNDLTALDVGRGGTDLEKSVARTPISQIPSPPMILMGPDRPLREVAQAMAEGNVGCVLICSDETLVGIFSERDLLRKIGERYDEFKERPIGDFMTPDPETLESNANIAFALNRMAAGGFRHLPIVQNGRPTALVSIRDLVRHLSEHSPPPVESKV